MRTAVKISPEPYQPSPTSATAGALPFAVYISGPAVWQLTLRRTTPLQFKPAISRNRWRSKSAGGAAFMLEATLAEMKHQF
jgi:hypothetical protein